MSWDDALVRDLRLFNVVQQGRAMSSFFPLGREKLKGDIVSDKLKEVCK